MARLHLFEWEDQEWFPAVFRRFITDHLLFHVRDLYAPAVPLLVDALKSSQQRELVDLCSGGAGPIPSLVPACSQALGEQVTATLTDLYPDLTAFENAHEQSDGMISFRQEPVSALDCPESLSGFRTLFTGLHHFRPDDARKILSDAVAKNVPIAAFEFTERSPRGLLAMSLGGFLSGLFWTPFVGRMSISRFLLTYVIPLAPFFLASDGVVSSLRTYSPAELKELTADLTDNGFTWQIGKVPSFSTIGWYNMTYLIGLPGNAEATS